MSTPNPNEQQINSSSSRPYRSKRLRPCDTCRQRKTACRIDSQPPCVTCRRLRVECRFEGPPSKRRENGIRTQGTPESSSVLATPDPERLSGSSTASHEDVPRGDVEMLHNLVATAAGYYGGPVANESMDLAWQDLSSGVFPALDHLRTNGVPPSNVRSLDGLDGFSAQYFGLSGETDPYMLRHFRFASEGETRFFKVHFRRLAAEWNDIQSTVPVHFMISADELGNAMKSETTLRTMPTNMSVRDELEEMVNPTDGCRLLGLFLRFVHPSFPIISRSQLGLANGLAIPDTSALSKLAPHLLAAIYAISIQFCHYDSVLCVSNVYAKPPTDRLWKIVLQEVLREIHTPRLSVLQATLLYLQKPQAEMATAVADSPFRWSLMGAATSLAFTLGLHLECRQWPIPSWEKRLRRRLWWAVYSESAWRSLLLGFPNPIHTDQWAVGALDEEDFVVDAQTSSENGTRDRTDDVRGDMSRFDFAHLTKLASIASDIYWGFYTLRASSRLASDFYQSLNEARPLRTRLAEWYMALPNHYKIPSAPESPAASGRPDGNTAAYLRLAYLVLELFIYRALLRPLGGAVPSEPAEEFRGMDPMAPSAHYELLNVTTADPAVEAVLEAAEGCARVIIDCASGLNARDTNSFWFSWSRICFATMSNFAVTLFIQAPSHHHARKAKKLVDDWMDALRMHSQSFSPMRLGLLRLNAMHWVGLRNISRASKWASDLMPASTEQGGEAGR